MSLRDLEIAKILEQSLGSYIDNAERLINIDLCDRCQTGYGGCYPCLAARIYFDKEITLLIKENSRWN
jgi:hypothetical protein